MSAKTYLRGLFAGHRDEFTRAELLSKLDRTSEAEAQAFLNQNGVAIETDQREVAQLERRYQEQLAQSRRQTY